MTLTTAPTKEYSIAIEHLELAFYVSYNTTPPPAEQARITAEQVSLPLVISVDASANKDEIADVICDLIKERCGWGVSAIDINWYESGVDAVDVTDLTHEQMGELYSMLHFYTRKCFDDFMLFHNEAIDDFISQKLGLDDLDNQLFDLIDEQVSFDFTIEGFDIDRYKQEQRASFEAGLKNL